MGSNELLDDSPGNWLKQSLTSELSGTLMDTSIRHHIRRTTSDVQRAMRDVRHGTSYT